MFLAIDNAAMRDRVRTLVIVGAVLGPILAALLWIYWPLAAMVVEINWRRIVIPCAIALVWWFWPRRR